MGLRGGDFASPERFGHLFARNAEYHSAIRQAAGLRCAAGRATDWEFREPQARDPGHPSQYRSLPVPGRCLSHWTTSSVA